MFFHDYSSNISYQHVEFIVPVYHRLSLAPPYVGIDKRRKMQDIADGIFRRLEQSSEGLRLLVAVVGCPGSGKSHVSKILLDEINLRASEPIAVILPLDGFHISRVLLTPQEISVRGCPSTFDGMSYMRTLKQIRYITNGDVFAPSFDHALKDPIANAIRISKRNRIVICEGLYLVLSDWFERAGMDTHIYDLIIYVNCNKKVLIDRITKRHVNAGICATEEAALSKYRSSDELNAYTVLSSLRKLIHSGRSLDFVVENTGDVPHMSNYHRTQQYPEELG